MPKPTDHASSQTLPMQLCMQALPKTALYHLVVCITDSLDLHKPYLEERAELAYEAEMLVHLRTGHLSEDITEAHSKPCFVFWFNSAQFNLSSFFKTFLLKISNELHECKSWHN